MTVTPSATRSGIDITIHNNSSAVLTAFVVTVESGLAGRGGGGLAEISRDSATGITAGTGELDPSVLLSGQEVTFHFQPTDLPDPKAHFQAAVFQDGATFGNSLWVQRIAQEREYIFRDADTLLAELQAAVQNRTPRDQLIVQFEQARDREDREIRFGADPDSYRRASERWIVNTRDGIIRLLENTPSEQTDQYVQDRIGFLQRLRTRLLTYAPSLALQKEVSQAKTAVPGASSFSASIPNTAQVDPVTMTVIPDPTRGGIDVTLQNNSNALLTAFVVTFTRQFLETSGKTGTVTHLEWSDPATGIFNRPIQLAKGQQWTFYDDERVSNPVGGPDVELRAAVFQDGTSFGDPAWVQRIELAREYVLQDLNTLIAELQAALKNQPPRDELIAQFQQARDRDDQERKIGVDPILEEDQYFVPVRRWIVGVRESVIGLLSKAPLEQTEQYIQTEINSLNQRRSRLLAYDPGLASKQKPPGH